MSTVSTLPSPRWRALRAAALALSLDAAVVASFVPTAHAQRADGRAALAPAPAGPNVSPIHPRGVVRWPRIADAACISPEDYENPGIVVGALAGMVLAMREGTRHPRSDEFFPMKEAAVGAAGGAVVGAQVGLAVYRVRRWRGARRCP
jgi:hypothetical protein